MRVSQTVVGRRQVVPLQSLAAYTEAQGAVVGKGEIGGCVAARGAPRPSGERGPKKASRIGEGAGEDQ